MGQSEAGRNKTQSPAKKSDGMTDIKANNYGFLVTKQIDKMQKGDQDARFVHK